MIKRGREAMGRTLQILLVAFGLLLAALLSACGDDASTQEANGDGRTEEATAGPTAEPTDPPEPEHIEFDAANFDESSTVIDNEWFPMAPGTQWAYDGFVQKRNDTTRHRIEFTVTDLTKEILGVNTVVAWIVDITEGEIVEKEIAFYAQDKEGNIWYFGEHPEEYVNGQFVLAPTWIAGVQDARPGVKMWAEPDVSIPPYFQGWGPEVEWSDFATIDERGGRACTPSECYEDTLVIAETSLDEVGIYQLKHYAAGVGEVRVGWRGDPDEKEGLQLASVTQLSGEALAAVRAEALALDAHAYEVSPEVYGDTPPAQ
jgi:hypothetical protein